MSEFNKQVGKKVSKDEADKLKKNFKKLGLRTESSFFGSDRINEILNTPGAIGLRITYGMDDEGNLQPVITAELSEISASLDTVYMDASLPCPPYCPK
jgi:hypothetical protein